MLLLPVSATRRLPAHAHACHRMRRSLLHLPHSKLPESAHKRLLQESTGSIKYTRVCSETCKSFSLQPQPRAGRQHWLMSQHHGQLARLPGWHDMAVNRAILRHQTCNPTSAAISGSGLAPAPADVSASLPAGSVASVASALSSSANLWYRSMSTHMPGDLYSAIFKACSRRNSGLGFLMSFTRLATSSNAFARLCTTTIEVSHCRRWSGQTEQGHSG